MDNTVAVKYIDAMGGKKSDLNDLAREICEWCRDKQIWLSAYYLPGTNNIEADKMSRNINEDLEWQLQKYLFYKIDRHRFVFI